MNSVVTQEQLQMILNSKDGLSLAQIEKILVKNFPLRPDETSGLYHDILNLIDTSTSKKEATLLIIQGIKSLLDRKLDEALENLRSGPESDPDETKLSPIFNRAG